MLELSGVVIDPGLRPKNALVYYILASEWAILSIRIGYRSNMEPNWCRPNPLSPFFITG